MQRIFKKINRKLSQKLVEKTRKDNDEWFKEEVKLSRQQFLNWLFERK